MKRWGIIITVFYSITLVFLLIPTIFYLLFFDIATFQEVPNEYLGFLLDQSSFPLLWIWIAILLCGQALLLFLSVDTSWRHNKPRQHVLVTSLLAGVLTGLLVFFYIWSLAASIYGDQALFVWPLSRLMYYNGGGGLGEGRSTSTGGESLAGGWASGVSGALSSTGITTPPMES